MEAAYFICSKSEALSWMVRYYILIKSKTYLYLYTTFSLLCLLNCSCNTKRYGLWNVKASDSKTPIPLATFQWTSDSIGGRLLEKYAMIIPARIKGIPHPLSFQFDLGANLTRLYGENVQLFKAKYPAVDFEHPEIHFGSLIATTSLCYIDKNAGEAVVPDNEAMVPIGTIGCDMFQDKVLIIDFTRQLFAVCDTVPQVFKGNLTDIKLDKYGRVLLPMRLKGRTFNVLFDNGSSIFPLLTSLERINEFSTTADIDTLEVNAWGTSHLITGRPLNDTLVFAHKRTTNTMVYADHNVAEEKNQYDAITGNALFWNNTVIIDFRNKKFGIR